MRLLLDRERPAFYLGSTAPDVQTVTGQARSQTHFFEVPLEPGAKPPWQRLLERYPRLARPAALPPSQVAFWAGYLCHLQADWLWVRELYEPFFGPACDWATLAERSFLHNVLRIYLDEQVLPEMLQKAAKPFSRVQPNGWMPFSPPYALSAWRDELASQFRPGAAARTVEVFSERQGIPPQAYYALLESESEMDCRVFKHLTRQAVLEYSLQLQHENCNLLVEYLSAREG